MRMLTLLSAVALVAPLSGCDSAEPDPASSSASPDLNAIESRLDAIEAQVNALEQTGSDTADLSDINETISDIRSDLSDLESDLASHADDATAWSSDLEGRLDDLDAALAEVEASIGSAGSYTDEMAVAAVQNTDPMTDPDRANLTDLWSQTERGYHWLTESRWTMDNRTDPPGVSPRHELVQMFHETPECVEGATFADCNSANAIKMFVNGPRITDHDWSDAGLAAAAIRPYHTHAGGLYIVSFGQGSTVSDWAYSLIPPSGIHLEPRGAHQAIRIEGSFNSGENIRIDTSLGSKGIAIYESPAPSPLCDALGRECEVSYPLYLRGGRLHLEDIEIERSASDSRETGPEMLHDTTLGIEHFYTWHTGTSDAPVHCTWNTRVTNDTMVKITPYGTSPDLMVAHSYAIVDVWGPGEAPEVCTVSQNIKTDAAGVYGYSFSAGVLLSGGFSVVLLGPDADEPLWPGDWGESQRPSFLYEVIEPL